MEVPGLAHNITSPLSPCEGMIKDLSLDALQLCERDGEETFACFSLGCWCTLFMSEHCRLSVLSLVLEACCTRLLCKKQPDGWMDGWMVAMRV